MRRADWSKNLRKMHEKLMGKKLTVRIFNPQYLGNILLNRALKEHSKLAYGIVLDIGCGESPYRELFQHGKVARYYTLDFPDYTKKYFSDIPKKQDVYADLENIPVRPDSVDCVLLTQVLEHLTEPKHCLEQVHNILKAGGLLFLSFPLLYPVHDEMDYYRFTKEGLKYLTEGDGLFDVIVLKELGNFWVSIGLLCNVYLYYGFFDNTFKNIQARWIMKIIRLVLTPLLFLIIGLINLVCLSFDYVLKEQNYAQGYFCIAAKKKQNNHQVEISQPYR